MTDSTLRTRAFRLVAMSCATGRRLAVIAVVLVTCVPSVARADGDPASDVLAAQSLFLPADAPLAPSLPRRLAAVLAAGAHRSPLRVAVIASAADLGAVTALWRQPQDYARFLGQEVSLLYRGEILVVMPNGYGLAQDGREPPAADAAVISRLPAPGRVLGSAALVASRGLLSAHGVAVPEAVSAAGAATSTGQATVTWFALGLGALVIGAMWAYSLRVRPLTARRRSAA